MELILEKCFDPDLLYRTAQTMFRPLPASVPPREQIVDPAVLNKGLPLRLRLFYAGLLAGHIPSALWLWSAVPYDSPAGKIEEEMILRCLDDEKANLVGKNIGILAQAVKADVAGDMKGARAQFDLLEGVGLGEFEFLWKRRVEYLFAVDEQKALEATLFGIPWISAYMIANTLEELMDFTKDEQMKIRLSIHLHEFLPTKYTFNSIAKSYDRMGDTMMAREYYEIAGATGDKESQEWIAEYLENIAKKSGFRRNIYKKELESWRRMMATGPDERLSK